ncbi:MAG: hypothetical protein AAB780_00155 [Patescibacteria group bacterium]
MLKVRHREFIVFILIILFLGVLSYLVPENSWEKTITKKQAPEISKILSLTNTKEQREELLKLLKRIGPIKAQEAMLHSGLPFTGETHLLVHTIGDFIYDEFGKEGLTYCKDYFLSACYHAVILNTLGDNGIAGVAEAMALCEKAGGGTVSSQCSHGAGHGFVAWHDYDLVKALLTCDELGDEVPNFPYFNCYDGVFMENIWGVHNGAPSEKRWVKAEDLYYPCNDPRIPEKYMRGCWSNQATLIYQHEKGDLRKTAEVCDTLSNTEYRETCYNNFSRQIHPLTQGGVEKVKSLCANATGNEWRDYCILTNMGAYWSVGDHQLPAKICESLTEPLKQTCFDRLESLKKY